MSWEIKMELNLFGSFIYSDKIEIAIYLGIFGYYLIINDGIFIFLPFQE